MEPVLKEEKGSEGSSLKDGKDGTVTGENTDVKPV